MLMPSVERTIKSQLSSISPARQGRAGLHKVAVYSVLIIIALIVLLVSISGTIDQTYSLRISADIEHPIAAKLLVFLGQGDFDYTDGGVAREIIDQMVSIIQAEDDSQVVISAQGEQVARIQKVLNSSKYNVSVSFDEISQNIVQTCKYLKRETTLNTDVLLVGTSSQLVPALYSCDSFGIHASGLAVSTDDGGQLANVINKLRTLLASSLGL